MEVRFVVPDELVGERADRLLARMASVSRSQARSAIDAGGVACDGVVVRPSDRLAPGSTVLASIGSPSDEVVADPTVQFAVAYEDDAVIVVDKPPGLVVHPGTGTNTATLAHGLAHRFPDLAALGARDRWGIVHRLDRDTSGLLVVARTRAFQERLQHDLKERRVERRYLALVEGSFDNVIGTVDAPIGRDPLHPTRMTVIATGRPSVTHYRRVAAWEEFGAAELVVRLETGRTHQIRVHLRAIGHPLVGDPVYGSSRRSPIAFPRTWLHSAELGFEHPQSGAPLVVHSPVPDDLRATLDALGAPDRGRARHTLESTGTVD